LAFVLQWQADFDRSIPHLRQALQLAVQIHNGRQYGVRMKFKVDFGPDPGLRRAPAGDNAVGV